MRLGTLDWTSALDHPDLLAAPVRAALTAAEAHGVDVSGVLVTAIDPELADTAAMTAAYELPLEVSGNCVLVAGRRGGDDRVAACVVRATTRADVNTTVRKLLDVRKASFLPMEVAVADSGMEYGAITPIGLPEHYRVLLDAELADDEHVVVGSGIRGSKIVLPGPTLAALGNTELIGGLGRPISA